MDLHQSNWRTSLRSVLFPVEDLELRRKVDPTKFEGEKRRDYFSGLSLCVVLINLIALALYDPLDDKSRTSVALNRMEYFFVTFFALETVLRFACLGVRHVLTRVWNIVDLVVFLVSVLSLALQSIAPQLSGISIIRAIRVLRPLRAFGRIPEIRLVMDSMLMSMKYLLDVGALYLLFLVAMSCAGIAQFSSKFELRCVRNEWLLVNNDSWHTTTRDYNTTGPVVASAVRQVAPFYNIPTMQTNMSWRIPLAVTANWSLLAALDPGIAEAFLLQNITRRYDILNSFPSNVSSQLPFISYQELMNTTEDRTSVPIEDYVCGSVLDNEVWLLALRISAAQDQFSSAVATCMQLFNNATNATNRSTIAMVELFPDSQSRVQLQSVLSLTAQWPTWLATDTLRVNQSGQSNFTAGATAAYQLIRAIACGWDSVNISDSVILAGSCVPRYGARNTSNPSFPFSWDAAVAFLSLIQHNTLPILLLSMVASPLQCSPTLPCDTGAPEDFFNGNQCPFGYNCDYVSNPSFGYFGFDHFGEAALTVLTTVTTENFPDLLYATISATSKMGGGSYSLVLIVIGSLFIVNLLVALVSIEFERCRTEELSRKRQERLLKQQGKSQQNLQGDDDLGVVTGLLDRISKKRKQALKELKTKMRYLSWREEGGESSTAVQRKRSLRRSSAQSHLGSSITSPPPLLPNIEVDGTYEPVHLTAASLQNRSTEEPAHDAPVAGDDDQVHASEALPPPVVDNDSLFFYPVDPAVRSAIAASITRIDLMRFNLYTRVVNTRPFFLVTSAMTLLMLGCMSVVYHGISQQGSDILDNLNIFFTAGLTLEMVLRFFATAPTVFVTDATQMTGAVVVAVAWADIGSTNFNLPVIRSLRLVVALKLLRYFPTLYGHLLIVVKSFRASLVLIAIISIEIFIFACVGMQIFGGRFCLTVQQGASASAAATVDCSNAPRLNFDTFRQALITSFAMYASDNWQVTMYTMMSTFESKIAAFFVAFLFVTQYYTGVYILLNLFIAILMSATEKLFSSSSAVEVVADEELQNLGVEDDILASSDEGERSSADTSDVDETTESKSQNDDDTKSGGSGVAIMLKGLGRHQHHVAHLMERVERARRVVQQETRVSLLTRKQEQEKATKEARKASEARVAKESGGLLRLQYLLRLAVESYAVNAFVLVVVIVSTVALAMEEVTLPPDHPKMYILHYIDVTCSSVFILDCLLHVLARGLFGGPESYLRKTYWNWLELFLVACNITDIIISTDAVNTSLNIHVVRALYALRPLRIMRRTPGIRVVLRSLFTAMKPLKDVIAITLIGWFLFALMGVQLFAGRARSCIEDPTIVWKDACQSQGLTWGNTGPNFDHIGEAFLSLFIVSTLQGWQNVLFTVMDMVSVNHAPVRDANSAAGLYVIAFAIIGGFFLISLFVSVLIRSYKQEKERLQRMSMFLTDEQEAWLRTHQTVLATMPLSEFLFVPAEERAHLTRWNLVRAYAIQLSLHPHFTTLINVSIEIMTLFSAMQHFPQPPLYATLLDYTNLVVTFLYLVEFIVKIVAVNPAIYFSSKWNRFDLTILIISIADIGLNWSSARSEVGGLTAGIKMFRTARLIRLTQYSTRLSQIVGRFLKSLYGLSNVAAFLALFIVVYALGACWGFGAVAKSTSDVTFSSNFDTFFNAVFLLVALLFGGSWSTVMDACSVDEPLCVSRIGNCGNKPMAIALFVTFIIVGNYVLLNIFVAVIVETFQGEKSEVERTDRNSSSASALVNQYLTENNMRVFVKAWIAIDTNRRLYIGIENLLPLLLSLPQRHPFAIHEGESIQLGNAPRQRLHYAVRKGFKELAFIASLGVESRNGCVEFFEVLTALTRIRSHVRHGSKGIVLKMKEAFERQFCFRLESRVQPNEVRHRFFAGETDANTVLQYYAANFLGDMWIAYTKYRGFRKRMRSESIARKKSAAGFFASTPAVSTAPQRTRDPKSVYWQQRFLTWMGLGHPNDCQPDDVELQTPKRLGDLFSSGGEAINSVDELDEMLLTKGSTEAAPAVVPLAKRVIFNVVDTQPSPVFEISPMDQRLQSEVAPRRKPFDVVNPATGRVVRIELPQLERREKGGKVASYTL